MPPGLTMNRPDEYCSLVVNVYVEVYAGGWRGMMPVVPAARMVMVVIIVVGFIAAREREGGNADEEGYAKKIFYSMFHDAAFSHGNRKTLPTF